MKKNYLFILIFVANYFSYSQNYFTDHLINQQLSKPIQIQRADINGDGDKDFAVTSVSGELTWHEQITNTTWKTHYISMDINGYSLAISDLDEDTNLDIIVTHNTSTDGNGKVSWFRNDGNQNFTQNILVNSNIQQDSNKTIVIDIDNDNDNDIISSIAGEIRILRNDGNENFTNESTAINLGNASLSQHSNDIEIIDFDNDGLLDFLVTTRNSNGINWYKQNNNNTFTDNIIATGTYINIAVGDIDNDNDFDILVTKDNNSSGGVNEVVAYLNTGDNSTFSQTTFLSLYTELTYLNLADIDNNGFLDIVYYGGTVSNQYEPAIRTILNPTISAITTTTIYNSSVFNGSGYANFILEDINLDNKIDIIQVAQSLGMINYYQNNDINQATSNFTLIEVSNSSSQAEGVAVADFNNDNKSDILVSSQHDHTLEWFNNNGDNSNFSRNRIDFLPRQNYIENDIVDVDGDGFIDVLSVNYNSTVGGSSWYKNNGDNTFTRHGLQINTAPVDITSSDFDNDGDIDILTVSDFDIYLFTNDGNENFTSSLLHSNGIAGNLYTAKPIDVNNDNLLDIVLLGDNRKLGFLLNNGGNSFSNFVSFQNPNGTDYQLPSFYGNLYDFEFADIDNDNDLDLFGIGNHLFYLKNNGLNQIEEENILITQSQYGAGRDLQIMDIDDDNDLDIIVGGDFGVYWAKNDNLIFTRELITGDNTTNRNAFGVEITDMDNDGDFDIVYTSYTGNKVAWLENKIEDTLSTTNLNIENDIHIYPNPTSAIITVSTNHSLDIKNIKLYNIQGRLINTYQNTNTIDITTIENGMYLLQIVSNKGTLTKQIIKQ